MANADHLILAIGVGAIVITVAVGAVLHQFQLAPPCPEREPVPQITRNDAIVVMATSYRNHLDDWEYEPFALLKWCHETEQWWIAVDADGPSYVCTKDADEVL